MGWLLREGEVLASLEVADTRPARRRGLLGRDSIDGALLLVPARSVHTIGMRFPIDVAWLDGDLTVLRTACHAAPSREPTRPPCPTRCSRPRRAASPAGASPSATTSSGRS